MAKQTTILEYKGHPTFSTIGRLLTQLKKKMGNNGAKVGFYKRMLSVMIETLENVYKYSDHYTNETYIYKYHLPTFLVELIQDHYIITVSNPIRKEDGAKLRGKIDMVNSKNADELKALYRQTISNGKFTEKGGAGLGIIEMAKISGNPLEYNFTPINDRFDLYTLRIVFK
jgi:hypothetical protein